MKKYLLIAITLHLFFSAEAQIVQLDTVLIPIPQDTTYWRKSFSSGANLNQASFSDNWKAGGENSIAMGLFLNTTLNYLKNKTSWDNDIQLKYGLAKNSDQGFRKNVDLIFLDSKYGYKLTKKWNFFIATNFITQFAPGYNYSNDPDLGDTLISNFMAPGFLTLATGLEYKPKKWFSLRMSPFAPRLTFLFDDAVGLVERYGVPVGSNTRTEFLAAMVQADLEKDIFTNTNLKFTYQGFANYETLAAKTIDHRLNVILTAKVNKFISMNISGLMLYDYDQDSKVQFSQGLGLGIMYQVQNFVEEK